MQSNSNNSRKEDVQGNKPGLRIEARKQLTCLNRCPKLSKPGWCSMPWTAAQQAASLPGCRKRVELNPVAATHGCKLLAGGAAKAGFNGVLVAGLQQLAALRANCCW